MMLREDVQDLLHEHKVRDLVSLVGIRAYYLRTMGDPERNDRGIYDDAIFVCSPSVYATFNANCDPSVFRRGIANLLPGVWRYRVGTHGWSRPAPQRYTALVQAKPVTVSRDQGAARHTGLFGINIHRGARASTSSLGCQTIFPDQWPAFIELVKSELKRHGQRDLPYLLTENAG